TPNGEVPPALRAFGTTARMSDIEVGHALGAGVDPRDMPARVAAVRAFQTAEPDAAAASRIFAAVGQQLDSVLTLARDGAADAAGAKAFDAYMTFEQVETSVRAKNPALANSLEAAFAAYRTRAAGGATTSELRGIRSQLASQLEMAERVLGDTLSPVNLFVQSLVIMLREGLEAILVVGALMTFLTKTGAGHRKRDIHVGVGAAVAASLLTAFALETVFQLTPGRREALEGITMMVATAVLFYVSYWLLSKMEVAKWTHFVRSKVQDAVTSGSALALASAAFLAVYREGFETVLFYKALFVAGGVGSTFMPVLSGILVGAVLLVGVYVGINRFGMRLPLKPFFGFTSAFLYYMAFIFAGKGVAELQEGGLVGTTILPWAPRMPALGIYPTVESLAAQGVLLVLALAALVWTFGVAPRLAAAGEAAASPREHPRAADAANESAALPEKSELIRALERMDADLAAVRAEVERIRDLIAERQPTAGA
ncbi:MAG: FTR1 family iron permease, partial [Gemmatimonadota bacterium]